MQAGQLDERVTIQGPSTTTGTHNEVVAGFAEAGTRWARFAPLRGSESMQALAVEAKLDAKIVMRKDSLTETITASHRLDRNNGDQYQVVGPATYPKERGSMIEFAVRRVA